MFDEAMELVNEIYGKMSDMKPARFLATVGTVMKIYSTKHDYDMSTMAIHLATVLLEMENEFN